MKFLAVALAARAIVRASTSFSPGGFDLFDQALDLKQPLDFWPAFCYVQSNDPKQHYATPRELLEKATAAEPCKSADFVVLATQESPMNEEAEGWGNALHRVIVNTTHSSAGGKVYWWTDDAGRFQLLEGKGPGKETASVVCGANGPAVAVFATSRVSMTPVEWWCEPELAALDGGVGMVNKATKGTAMLALQLQVGRNKLLVAAASTHGEHGGGKVINPKRESQIQTAAERLRDVGWLVGKPHVVPDLAFWGADMNQRTIMMDSDPGQAPARPAGLPTPQLFAGDELRVMKDCLARIDSGDLTCARPEWLARGPDRLGETYANLPDLLNAHGALPDGTPFLKEVEVRSLCPTKEKAGRWVLDPAPAKKPNSGANTVLWKCCPPEYDLDECSADTTKLEIFRFKNKKDKPGDEGYRPQSDRPSWCDRLVVGVQNGYKCEERAHKLRHEADHDALFAACVPPSTRVRSSRVEDRLELAAVQDLAPVESAGLEPAGAAAMCAVLALLA